MFRGLGVSGLGDSGARSLLFCAEMKEELVSLGGPLTMS